MVNTLVVSREAVAATFDKSFEEVAEQLNRWPRMFIEPDGSFVWVAPQGEAPWQVDGVLYDRAGRLLYVELKGNCPEAEFDRFLAACGWPQAAVMFQLLRAAVFVDEQEFRCGAQAGG